MLISNFFSNVDLLLTTSLKLEHPLPSLLTPSLYPFFSTDFIPSPALTPAQAHAFGWDPAVHAASV